MSADLEMAPVSPTSPTNASPPSPIDPDDLIDLEEMIRFLDDSDVVSSASAEPHASRDLMDIERMLAHESSPGSVPSDEPLEPSPQAIEPVEGAATRKRGRSAWDAAKSAGGVDGREMSRHVFTGRFAVEP